MKTGSYPCVAVNPDAFLAQLLRYIRGGHFFYVSGLHPDPDSERNQRRTNPKSLEECDRNIVEKFAIEMTRWERSRRRKAGRASVHYLRVGRMFVIVATKGEHRFFEEHKGQFSDVRRTAIRFGGYAVRHTCCQSDKSWHTLVRLEQWTYKRLKANFELSACKKSKQQLEKEIRRIYFQCYGPVIEQLRCIVRAVNRKRKAAGITPIDASCIRRRIRIARKPQVVPSIPRCEMQEAAEAQCVTKSIAA